MDVMNLKDPSQHNVSRILGLWPTVKIFREKHTPGFKSPVSISLKEQHFLAVLSTWISEVFSIQRASSDTRWRERGNACRTAGLPVTVRKRKGLPGGNSHLERKGVVKWQREVGRWDIQSLT